MHASQPCRFDQHLDVIRDAVSDVVRAGDGLRRDLEHLIDAGLVDTDGSSEGRETCVGGVPGLVDNVDVKVFHLVIKQCLGGFILGPICGKAGGYAQQRRPKTWKHRHVRLPVRPHGLRMVFLCYRRVIMYEGERDPLTERGARVPRLDLMTENELGFR